jgi:osmotically-inducible protein OsmY
MRTVFSFALGVATGAAAARFLTPTNGRKLAEHASGAASAASSQAHQATNKMKGAVHAVTPHKHEPMDDMTLADRVRSEIFRDTEAPKGGVSVDVQAGVAYLRGEVPDDGWVERFGTAARKVTGINGVKNLLHTPGTPTPTAEPRAVASEQFRR